MLKGQPKGLFVLALANMGERFGYYTMLAIFVLYLQAKFGFTKDQASTTYGIFMSMIYFLPLFGGLLADKVLGYSKTIILGIVIMFIGYFCLSIPTGVGMEAQMAMFGALALIALGTGCFKGNLQALIGNLYDDPKYSAKRDIAFSIFYMCINIGAFFAPSAADGVSNYFMAQDGYKYDPNLPALVNQFKQHTITPEGYVNLAIQTNRQHEFQKDSAIRNDERVIASGNLERTVVIDPQAWAALNSSVLPADSIAQQMPVPSAAMVFGTLLGGEELVQLDRYADSVILGMLAAVQDSALVNAAAVRQHIYASLTPVNDTAACVVQYNTIVRRFAEQIGTIDPEVKLPILNRRKDSTALLMAEAIVGVQLQAEIGQTIDPQKLQVFGASYLPSLSRSYNYSFGVACLSLIVSMLIFVGFRKYYKAVDKTEKQKIVEHTGDTVELTPQQVKDRLVALGLVFIVVIFFWMSFHQNGLTMTFFARDYTQTAVSGFDRFGFSLLTLLPFAVCFYGVLSIFQGTTARAKGSGAALAVIGGGLACWAYRSFPAEMSITPQIFQQFNAYFIVLFTPITVAFFSWLNKKGKEPSAPRKIGIGMVIAALGFVLLAVASVGLPTPNTLKEIGGLTEAGRVSPNWLIGTYFVLTIAELFLSPMGISFVSKVAPPKYKGLAQGGWLAATAVGNYLLAIIGYLWGGMPLWILWGILVACCAVSAIFLFSVMKKLERTTQGA